MATAMELEKEKGYVDYLRMLGCEEPVEVQIRDQIIHCELQLRNIDGAQREFAILKERFPDSKTTQRLGRLLDAIARDEVELRQPSGEKTVGGAGAE